MASFEPQDFGLDEPPPRLTTPPVRRGFLVVLVVLSFMAILVYGIPYVAEQAGYAWESGRSRAAMEALQKLDKAGIVSRSSALFRMATVAVAPAVVHVQTRHVQRGGGGMLGAMPGGGGLRRFGRGPESLGLGSGVIIDKQGYVVTNNHVVKDADEIVVRLSHGIDVPARVVGTDAKTDLAVLKINAEVKVAAEWGDSDKLDIGDWVLAIGSPFAIDRTVTAGIVSATERNDLRINEYESFIQTDAAINPGNSGGPLIDLSGKVVGINSAIISQHGGYEGIGLAIPATMARRVVESLIKDGKVVRGYLGVRIQPLNPALAREFHLPAPQGALVSEVVPGSPAERAGLKVGDVIVKLGDREVRDPAGLRNETAGTPVGHKTSVSFYREGKLQSADVTIAEMAAGPILASLGFRVREVPERNAPGGERLLVIEEVQPASPAHAAGLQPGMRVLGVGSKLVHTLAEYEAAAAAFNPAEGLPLRVATPDGQTVFVTVGGAGGR
jgi:serine protease Do